MKKIKMPEDISCREEIVLMYITFVLFLSMRIIILLYDDELYAADCIFVFQFVTNYFYVNVLIFSFQSHFRFHTNYSVFQLSTKMAWEMFRLYLHIAR